MLDILLLNSENPFKLPAEYCSYATVLDTLSRVAMRLTWSHCCGLYSLPEAQCCRYMLVDSR